MPTRRALLLAALATPVAAQPLRRSADPGIAFPAAGRRAWADAVPVIRIGLSGSENETDRLARTEPYRRLVEETFAVPVRLHSAPDFAGLGQAFAAGRIEVVLFRCRG